MGSDVKANVEAQVQAARPSFMRNVAKQFTALLRFIKQDKFVMVGVLIYVFLILLAIFAPLIAPYSPHEMIKKDGELMFNQPPSADHQRKKKTLSSKWPKRFKDNHVLSRGLMS